MAASRLTGLLRVLVVGALMGPTFLSNIFQAGSVLAANTYTVMAGPVLAMVVVPAVVQAVTANGAARAGQVLGRVSGRLLVIAAAAAVALAAASPLLGWALVAGMPDAERSRAWLLVIVLTLFVCPQVLLYTLASLGVAAQQAQGRFALPAMAPALESVGTMLTVVVATAMYGRGLQVGQAPLGMMVALGVGTTCSVLLHAVVQLVGAARAGIAVRPHPGWRGDQQARDPLRRIVQSVPVAASPIMTMFLLTAASSTVPGGVLIIQLSYQVFYGLSFVGARAVSTASLPQLAEASGHEGQARFAAAWRHGLWLAVVVSMPPLALLIAFARPTADLLANGELRDGGVIGMLASCLAVVAVTQLAGGIHDLGRQALFARLDHRGPRLASFVSAAAGVGVGLLGLLVPVTGGRLTALTAAILAAELAGAVTVLLRLRRDLAPHRLVDRRGMVSVALAFLALLPPVCVGYWLTAVWRPERLAALVLMCGTGLVSLAAYAVVLKLRGGFRPSS
jgi:peptidoglycan biosynthesis protein MviN/MurJ (putative lipid II flippase)